MAVAMSYPFVYDWVSGRCGRMLYQNIRDFQFRALFNNKLIWILLQKGELKKFGVSLCVIFRG